MYNDLIEDKLSTNRTKEKLVIEIFIKYYLKMYIYFTVEMGELKRYYLLVISNKKLLL